MTTVINTPPNTDHNHSDGGGWSVLVIVLIVVIGIGVFFWINNRNTPVIETPGAVEIPDATETSANMDLTLSGTNTGTNTEVSETTDSQ